MRQRVKHRGPKQEQRSSKRLFRPFVELLENRLAPNAAPLTPLITEPSWNGAAVGPFNVPMATGQFVDADGPGTPDGGHLSTDWLVFRELPLGDELVWMASDIRGAQRTQAHLGDGVFLGSLEGVRDLPPDTNYRLDVRFRDDSGDPATQYSPFARRTFQTSSDVGTPGLAAAPATPVFTLPVVDGFIVPFTNVQLETNAFSDSDPGDFHASTDWELYTATSTGTPTERVWSFFGATGQERIHTDLGDGVFEGSHTGQREALPDTFYVAQARHRDNNGEVSAFARRFFRTSVVQQGEPDQQWALRQAGYVVEVVASGFLLPVGVAFVPEGRRGTGPNDPSFYVAELYGAIKVVANDGSVLDYATNLLNFNPTGAFPGSGEQGIGSILVEPATGDVIISQVYSLRDFDDSAPHFGRVVRFKSSDGGLTASSSHVILDTGTTYGFSQTLVTTLEAQGQSHQISNVSIGPDGLLYVHNGEGFDVARAGDIGNPGQRSFVEGLGGRASFGGKILRMNLDDTPTSFATPVSDNPFFSLDDGITARDYVYAYGLRNPFGGAWRAADGQHYTAENGPDTNDRLSQLVAGRNYLWNGSAASMTNFAIYNWNPPQAPVNIAFVQPETFGGSAFPSNRQDRAYVSLSGPTYGLGPQSQGKRIHEFNLAPGTGQLVGGPVTLVEYIGTGRASVAALAAGPDGLYFSDLYRDAGSNPIARGANVLRVKFVGAADFTATCDPDRTVHFTDKSSVLTPALYYWDFGDGATSTDQNSAHTYAQDGVYDVRLTVSSIGGAAQVTTRRVFVGVQQIAGFRAEYFNGIFDLAANPNPARGPSLIRVDPRIDFDFGNGSPALEIIGVDNFTVRWSGKVIAPVTGTYTFTTRTDDGVRLYLNDQLKVDQWVPQGATRHSATIDLIAGEEVDIRMEYFEGGAGAVAQLFWTPPGQAEEVVQSTQSFPLQQQIYGFVGDYFTGIIDLVANPSAAPTFRRIEGSVNYDFGTGTPVPSFIGNDNFTVRWTGQVTAPVDGIYTFTTQTDDGARLFVNGVPIVDQWVNQGPTRHSGTISLTAGEVVDVRMDYYEAGAGALARLFWTPPGRPEEVLPSSQLFTQDGFFYADYFDNIDFTARRFRRFDAVINSDYGGGSPDPRIGPDDFTVRWAGNFVAPATGTYTFTGRTDDGVRVFVDGRLIVDFFIGQGPTPRSGTIDLVAGQLYEIRMDYFEGGGGALAQLYWRPPGQPLQLLRPDLLCSVPLDTTIATPTNLRSTAVVPPDRIDLAWNDNSDNEGGFLIERSSDGTTFNQIDMVGPNVTTYSNTGITPGTYTYRVRAVGQSISDGQSAWSNRLQVRLFAALAPTNLQAPTFSAKQIDLAWNDNSSNETGFRIERSTNGATFSQIAIVEADTTTFTDSTVAGGAVYFYRVRAITGFGDSDNSNPTTVDLVLVAAATINKSNGFVVQSDVTRNSGAAFSGTYIRLTDGVAGGQAGSLFSNTAVDIATFNTQFTLQIRPGDADMADGMAFVIQRNSPTALGASGGALGYQGIANSVAVKFDIFQNGADPSNNTTGVFTNGQAPFGGVNLNGTPINLRSLHTFRVDISYSGTTLSVTIRDLETGGTDSRNYSINIPAVVGSPTAFVGFTAGTGGLRAIHEVQTWRYEAGAAAPAAPSLLRTTAIAPTEISFAWNDNSDNELGFRVERSLTGTGGWAQVGADVGPDVTTFTDTVPSPGVYFYRVQGFNAVGNSGFSNVFRVDTTAGPEVIDHSGGFTSVGQLTRNGSAAFVGSNLHLTDGVGASQAGSMFHNNRVQVTNFTTEFTFQIRPGSVGFADGFMFVIQGNNPGAIGPSGGGLGFGPDTPGLPPGIPNSVGVKFDIFQNGAFDPSNNTTGLHTNGEAPTGGVNLIGTGIDLRSQHVFRANMSYNGTTLTVTITDTETLATHVQNYNVNIPAVVGGNTAFVGFTAGTGGQTAIHEVRSWRFDSV